MTINTAGAYPGVRRKNAVKEKLSLTISGNGDLKVPIIAIIGEKVVQVALALAVATVSGCWRKFYLCHSQPRRLLPFYGRTA